MALQARIEDDYGVEDITDVIGELEREREKLTQQAERLVRGMQTDDPSSLENVSDQLREYAATLREYDEEIEDLSS